MSSLPVLSPEDVRDAAERACRFLIRAGHDDVADRPGLHLLAAGAALHELFRSNATPDRWESLLRFAHGALNQALWHIDRVRFQYAATCLHLGNVCTEIARWTDDPAQARRAINLFEVAAGHVLVARDEDVLARITAASAEARAALSAIEWHAAADLPDTVLSRRLSAWRIDAGEAADWLSQSYGVDRQARAARSMLPRLHAWIEVALDWLGGERSAPQALHLASRGSRTASGAGGEPLRVMVGRPLGEDERLRDVRLEARPHGDGTAIVLFLDQKEGGEIVLPEWRVGIQRDDRAEPTFATADAYGDVILPDVPFDQFPYVRIAVFPAIQGDDQIRAAPNPS